MILMAVREDDPHDPIPPSLQIRKVRVIHIHPEIGVGKGNATIDDEQLASSFDGKTIHPDFA